MLDESYIMTLVLFELMKQRVPAIPVHDSVIVPAQREGLAKQVMLQCYKNHTGFEIGVK